MVAGEAIRRTRDAIGVTLASVAAEIGIDAQTLMRYETAEAEIPDSLLWRVSDTLGVPFDEITSDAELAQYTRALAVRFKADELGLADHTRLAVARAAAAAREYVALEEIAARPDRYDLLTSRFHAIPAGQAKPIWREGRARAAELRDTVGLSGPIESMLNLVSNVLRILVVWQRLPSHIAGYALCSRVYGPTIVVNVNGRNANELVRRFTLAHELCHVLFDRLDLRPVANFDRYDDLFDYSDDTRDPSEVRANAFGIHLLAPETMIEDAWNAEHDPQIAVRHFMTTFGISYEATRNHLANYALLGLTHQLQQVPTAAPDEFKVAESSELWYPAFDAVPIERRHAVAALAFDLWSQRTITTSRLREALGVPLMTEELLALSELYVR